MNKEIHPWQPGYRSIFTHSWYFWRFTRKEVKRSGLDIGQRNFWGRIFILGFRMRPLQRHIDLGCFQNSEQGHIGFRLTHHQSTT